ncbi:hypothetical protein JMA_18750 [Jeotgalibacillus malaysiensis]|uniref:Uncharacterized protein n=1 Tax=Jeotgalibacillus malaysiensis TaxID=1508404 RepID=A0A0B5ARB6_9BACL|nr:hypothetical protein JMA_18750 [Jeotgalibacillus malaysiensis]
MEFFINQMEMDAFSFGDNFSCFYSVQHHFNDCNESVDDTGGKKYAE